MPKITKRLVDSLTPDPFAEVYAWDTELKGFGVRVMPSGVASYVVKYRTAEGRQRKLAIARVGAATPDEVRKVAREKLGAVVRGADPSAERHKIRGAVTVAELCDLYLADAVGRVKASTLAMDRSRIERHVKPLLGARRVPALTSDDVEAMQRAIEAGKTAAARVGVGGVTTGGKGVASRTVGMLGTILEFAKRKKIITANPARGVQRAPDGRQRRFLSAVELGRLGQAMREAENDGETATGIAAVRFLLLTGCRRMEALALPRAWLDEEHSCIRFGDTKSGAQLRPIGKAAFGALPFLNGSPWAFPAGRGDGHFVGLPKVLDRLCARAGLQGVTVHVLRHSFAAAAAAIGYSELTIAGLLGHSVPGVTARYAHVPDAVLVAAADAVAGRMLVALER
ncbi:tyrosine-type recombinase/integrase [Methylobacterium durans]|uniref:Integrase n=1 Tax=Methylobacterium durans TaxID=2202825 RepID=A0A2U8WH74_9HYPH|nr:site-specific integrase [Methylobacterium durans]AWN44881.1 integrase [Methylobacterium durans]